MPGTRTLPIALAFMALVAGCSSKPTGGSPVTPTAPATSSTSTTMDTFSGTWTSGAGGGAPGNTCSGVNYTFNKTSDTSASVTYSGSCSGITITGTGKGTLIGSVLNWDASGSATGNGLNCAFSFSNSTATPQADGILVTYNGTVCGLTVSGSHLVHKR
jgi:hypothetical protein